MTSVPISSPLILASRSPRRRDLLREAGYRFTVMPASDEAEAESGGDETATALVARLARQKAADVASRVESGVVLGADTVAECGGQILGKPTDARHAREMLTLLRGREHYVHTGVCLWRRPDDRVEVTVDTTTLVMDAINDAQLAEYLDSGAWEGKAGAFGYQDRLGWIKVVEGSESNVVGLPMELLAQMLGEMDQSP